MQQVLSPNSSLNININSIGCQKSEIPFAQQLKKHFVDTFELQQKLFSIIKNFQTFYLKPEPLRHPLIFYYGHTASFYVNKIMDKGIISERVNQHFERMFAVGVDQMDWDDLNEEHYDWPSVPEVKQYRLQVRNLVISLLSSMKEEGLTWESNLWSIAMAIEHQRLHIQTSSVIIRRLPVGLVSQPQWFQQCPYGEKKIQKVPSNSWVKVPSFRGEWDRKIQSTTTYGWDYEYGEKSFNLRQFNTSKFLVSNAQYYQFYKEKGYQKPQFWSEQGQSWLKSTKTKKPLFWEIKILNAEQQTFYLKTMTDLIEMPWDWPVEVNNLEAQAFCKWKSLKKGKNIRLPTEDEYYAMRNLIQGDSPQWQGKNIGNLNLKFWFSPCPVNLFQNSGIFDIVGNVWQHTVTPFYPFKGFKVHPLYEDFSSPTFDNRHYLMKGGSFITTGNSTQIYDRVAFRKHFYQFAGFRYVVSDNSTQIPFQQLDQSDEAIKKSVKVHYTAHDSYIQRISSYIQNKKQILDGKKSLVVGCSVGRLPLELSKYFQLSMGIDYTAHLFKMATILLQQGSFNSQGQMVQLERFGLHKNDGKRIYLMRMNPQNLDTKKINQIDFAIIDGWSLKYHTLQKVLKNCYGALRKNTGHKINLLLVTVKEKNQIDLKSCEAIFKFLKIKNSQSVLLEDNQTRLLWLEIVQDQAQENM